ncbi:imm11 family protein [Hyalangium versicolor]|uniref:imm11 family protein n=1 Tax=Hyalangium versicolor TaxID=2861190 RepID=UPI001CCCC56C|nr:DUF1629 domain-containing protein [Hyalangium versicolor]
MKYFDLFDDMRHPDRWLLGDPTDAGGGEIDPWQFEKGIPLELKGTARFAQYHPGEALDFSLAGMGVPVVHRRVVSVFERLGLFQQVQFFPAQVEGHPEPYFILNVLRTIRCIDEARCEEVLYWTPEDGRPEKVGQYRNVAGMRIDPSKVGDAHIFRPWGWRVALILSEHLKQALEAEGITGLRFVEV